MKLFSDWNKTFCMIEKNHKKKKVVETLLDQFLIFFKMSYTKNLNPLCLSYHVRSCNFASKTYETIAGLLHKGWC